ncbi:TerB family tellurite resistance protein [Treponema denticola]|uniref:hypothetical protein n=1 Tax=Treponema denticola TaxID=158 RepID=UPI0020A45CD0|nr:hypothetical protein [Treponema denticola]UTD12288.1 TerB family tellurite resistance protein [Treponema denticola]
MLEGRCSAPQGAKMFLSQLKYNQKKCFLSLANYLLNIDGEFDEFESDYLRAICAEMSLSNGDIEPFTLDSVTQKFPEQEARKILLIESMALALCNEEYDQSEKLFIEDLAKKLDLISDLVEIKNMVERHFKNQKNLISYIFSEE